MGSRDQKKTKGRATEEYLNHVLPKMGCHPHEHFVIDPNDGVCKYFLILLLDKLLICLSKIYLLNIFSDMKPKISGWSKPILRKTLEITFTRT